MPLPLNDPLYAETLQPSAVSGASNASSVLDDPHGAEQREGALFEAGAQLGQYEVIRAIGQGGMGTVYLARDNKLGRKVAIKVLRSRSTGAKVDARFLREAQATAQCSHDNIVVIHEVSEYQGQLFMVLEYLEGAPLRRLLDGRRVSVERAVDLMLPVVRALVRAHAFGIVHRDLKPENVFVCDTGTLKVLDFGVAKLLATHETGAEATTESADAPHQATSHLAPHLTSEGARVGTLRYMAPEQWAGRDVDHRVDIFAVGIMLWELVVGQHPMSAGRSPAEPMPPIREVFPEAPLDLQPVVDRCLAFDPEHRFESAEALLEALLPLNPHQRALAASTSPYPGLTAFREQDAARFFGRGDTVGRLVTSLAERPLVAVVGPSGVGKSSFVQAGVLPQLKAAGPWESLVCRPGRHPLDALAQVLEALTGSDTASGPDTEAVIARLRAEPGFLGFALRQRAQSTGAGMVLVVDQTEELYTLCEDADAQRAFTACLTAAADDPSSPTRVLLSLRTDFLDRLDADFLEVVGRGLTFLHPPTRAQLEESLRRPAELVGYRFEDDALVAAMLDALERSPAPLPLLQFAAARLWETRDRERKLLTRTSYDSLGGLSGVLASHADEVVAGLPRDQHVLVRALFRRLVTAERTRAVVELSDLAALSEDATVAGLVDRLVEARLLVIQQRGDDEGATVELAHEALIDGWPTLQRWLDETQQHAALLEQLRAAAKQWSERGRTPGLLWRGPAADDARYFHRHYETMLAPLELEFATAVAAHDERTARNRRMGVIGVIVTLLVLIGAAVVALVQISAAEQEAKDQANIARQRADEVLQANAEAQRQAAEKLKKEQERAAAAKKAAAATKEAAQAKTEVRGTKDELAKTVVKLQTALTKSEKDRKAAEAAKKTAEEATSLANKASARAKLSAAEEAKARKKTQELLAKERKALAEERKKRGRLEKRLKQIETGGLR